MTQLLERDDELARLHQWLVEARSGRGRVVFVGGEPGIGKTSLVTAFASDAGAGVRVGIGRCDALATPRALGPFLEAAADLGVAVSEQRDGFVHALAGDLRSSGPT
ncbi:MAG: AAA family ATPase, partial [Ilumatobacteraceae bacterium]